MKEEILRLNNIGQYENGRLHRCISLVLHRAEALCVVAEDLDTKDFLLKVLQGMQQPDTGSMYINDRYRTLRSPEKAREAGLFYIEEAQLIPHMTIAENFFMHQKRFYGPAGWDARKVNREADAFLDAYELGHLKGQMAVEKLSPVDRCLTAILRAVLAGASILVVDNRLYDLEDPAESRKILRMTDLLKEKGLSVLWFTNRWEAIYQKCDRYVVIQNGLVTKTAPLQVIPPEIPNTVRLAGQYAMPVADAGETILECRHLSLRYRGKEQQISFRLNRGEILGIHDCNNILIPLMRRSMQNRHATDVPIHIKGQPYLRYIRRKPVGLICQSENRNRIFPHMNLCDNVTLLIQRPLYGRLGFVNDRVRRHLTRTSLERLHEEEILEQYEKRADLREMSLREQFITEIAKWICTRPDVLCFINPHDLFEYLPEYQFQEMLEILRTELGISVMILSTGKETLNRLCGRVLTV